MLEHTQTPVMAVRMTMMLMSLWMLARTLMMENTSLGLMNGDIVVMVRYAYSVVLITISVYFFCCPAVIIN